MSQTPSQPEPPPPAAVEDTRPAIVAFGDSITAGYGLEPGQAYPELLQGLLDAAGYGYRVVNAGLSGDTTDGGLTRLPAVLAMKPKVVLLELGGNDGLRGIPVASTRANLDEMIGRLRQSHAAVLLAGMTLPRNYGPDYIQSFEKMYAELAAKHGVELVPFRLERIGRPDELQSLIQTDGIHPTAEGQRRLARYLLPFLEPALGRSSPR